MEAELLQGYPQYFRNGVIHEGVEPERVCHFYLLSQRFIRDTFLCFVRIKPLSAVGDALRT